MRQYICRNLFVLLTPLVQIISVCSSTLSMVLNRTFECGIKRLTNALLSLGFMGSETDTSLFYMSTPGDKLFCLIYVDDILVMGNNLVRINALVSQLQSQFAVRDLGTLSHCLGTAATWTKEGLFLSQHEYVTKLLHRAQMDSCIPVTTLISLASKLSSSSGIPLSDPSMYCSIIGAL